MAVLKEAPPFRPSMPRTGQPFSVRMSNCGPLGWVSDASGYRYQPLHPEVGRPWPPIPDRLLEAWFELGGFTAPPEACLINLYDGTARMGLHQDRDEAELSAPVVSLSLGDTALFRLGGMNSARSDPLVSARLRRRTGARRTGAAVLPWRRPRDRRLFDPAARRRTDQSDAATGDTVRWGA